ncbi:MAG TPA: hypothetical protein VGG16_15925 [Streptosporangiaceae bacterium]|jgi:hypothetical protein
MGDPGVPRLVGVALRCYPARWRQRHGAEAAELAALLIRDGTSPWSIFLSYLAGASRAWLVPRPGRRLSRVACALLIAACSLGLSAGLLASAAPARAASPGRTGEHGNCQPGHVRDTPGTGRPRVRIGKAGHDQTC